MNEDSTGIYEQLAVHIGLDYSSNILEDIFEKLISIIDYLDQHEDNAKTELFGIVEKNEIYYFIEFIQENPGIINPNYKLTKNSFEWTHIKPCVLGVLVFLNPAWEPEEVLYQLYSNPVISAEEEKELTSEATMADFLKALQESNNHILNKEELKKYEEKEFSSDKPSHCNIGNVLNNMLSVFRMAEEKINQFLIENLESGDNQFISRDFKKEDIEKTAVALANKTNDIFYILYRSIEYTKMDQINNYREMKKDLHKQSKKLKKTL